MPKTTIQQRWCADHNDGDNTCCSQIAAYGPDAFEVPWGGFWIQQSLERRTSALWTLPQIHGLGAFVRDRLTAEH